MKDSKKILIVIFFLILFLLYLYLYKKKSEYFSEEIPDVGFPYKNVRDDKGNKLNVIAISAPFRDKTHMDMYNSYKNKGLSFIGISSYLDFPNHIDNPHEDRFHEKENHDYTEMVKPGGWLHCFRKEGYTKPFNNLPHMLMTESDLKDTSSCVSSKDVKKEYDFIYICLKDSDTCQPGWQSYNRNWELAKKCLEVFCRDFKLRGLLVGREECEFTRDCDGIVKVVPFAPYHEFQDLIKKSKWLFVPNIADAAPRVITESMCHDLPVLVNQNILGGWHNVVPGVTGEFFNDETDIGDAVRRLLENIDKYRPMKWFKENRGREHSGVELADFLKKNYPNLNNKDLTYAYI